MPQTVPPLHIFGVKGFLELPDEVVAELLSALEIAPPQFNAEELAKTLFPHVSIPKHLLNSITSLLISLYRSVTEIETSASSPHESISRFLDKLVYPSLRREEVFSTDNKNADWSKLRSFLLRALSMERSVGTTAKAGPILTQHERIFQDVKIMTDLRPIYHLDVSEKPDGLLVIHMLKITQRNQRGEQKDNFFALDTNDLVALRKAVERAEAKEVTLREMVADSQARVIDVKLRY